MASLRFDIRPAREDERAVCERLLQLYMYDFSEFAGGTAKPDGHFPYHDDFGERWGKPSFHPILLTVFDEDPRDKVREWRPAGFAFVANYSCFSAEPEPDQWYMDDFFVMRKYRRSGIGTMLARHCFDSFRGRWEVGEIAQNVGAQAFWRKVIGDYTSGNFEEFVPETGTWTSGPLQRFRNW
jgi:predicted acetyltransferase